MYQVTRSTGACAAAAVSLFMAAPACAGSTAGTAFDVKITISAGCSISNDATAVDFGTVIGFGVLPAPRTKTATITCSNSTPYDFHVASINSFRMKDAGGNAIQYRIKAGASTTPLGSTPISSNFTQMGTGAAQTITFTFEAFGWPVIAPFPSGVYTDTVTLYVDF